MELLKELSTFPRDYITEDVVSVLQGLSGELENHKFPNMSTENLAKALAGLTIEVRRVSADENLSRNLLGRLDINQTLELGIRVFDSANGRTRAEAQMLYLTYIKDLTAYKSNARGSDELPDRVRYIANMYSQALKRVDTLGGDSNV